ncbi:MAG: hypothetical protein ACJATN_002253 [Neolewinella sp.]|jgi:hypothetical protein
MKFLITLLTFNFLCVWCFGFEDCEDGEITCSVITSVLPQIREAIPYDGVDMLRFRYGDDPMEVTARVIKTDGLADGLVSCEDFIEASFTTVNSQRNFSFLLSTSLTIREELNVDFRFGLAGSQPAQVFTLQYGQSDVIAADPSINVVANIDTMLAGFPYEGLLLVTDQAATEDGKITTFFLSTEFGLVQVARINSPLITLIQ